MIAVAKRLRSLQSPFILASAYERFDFKDSEVLAEAENVGKPFTPRQVLAALWIRNSLDTRRISTVINYGQDL